MSQKLIIDAQIFQTPAWHRGMGKYSIELLHTIFELSPENWASTEIILSKNIKTEDGLLDDLHNKLPGTKVVMLDLMPNDFANQKIVEHNRKTIDSYISKQTQPVTEIDYLILSLMQREIFPAFPSADGINKFLLFYDLIPLLLHNSYLKSSVARGEYLSKISELLKADHYFAISKTVANDLALYLGIDKSRITNINGGPIEHSDETKSLKVKKPFILMPTGNDSRKNNRRAIIGFNEFNKLQKGEYTLVATSFFSEREKKELGKLAENTHFTGNISGSELSYLYEQSTAVLFPSEHEGLGLPILEAVEKNKPVACSNISVFHEISSSAFSYFEPRSIIGIEQALRSAVSSSVNEKEYKAILAKYRWEDTARKLVEVIHEFSKQEDTRKRPLAVFGPDPAYNSASGKFMQEYHSELSRQFDTHYYFARNGQEEEERINYLPYVTKTTKISGRFSFEPQDYCMTVYNISNNEDCAEILLAALAVPGLLILHDTKLDKLWRSLLDKQLVSPERYELEAMIHEACKVPGADWLGSLLQNQKAIVVFSKYQKQLIEKTTTSLGSTVATTELTLPAGNLVYPQSMPDKVIDIGEFNANSAKDKSDFQRDEAFSKMKTVIFDKDSSKYQVVSAMRFDAIPFVSAGDWRTDFSDEFSIKYKSNDQAKGLAYGLLSDAAKYLSTRARVANYAQACPMHQFTSELQQVIEEAQQ